jgi:two-component system, NarL family, response regulator NreC
MVKERISIISPYRLLLADDHSLFRGILKRIINKKEELTVVGEANDGLELMKLLKECRPNMVILDISMPNMNGIEAAIEIAKKHPEVCVLILSMHKNSEYLQQAISAGAKGYVLKENIDEDIFFAIDTIMKGGVYFSKF